SEDASWIHYAGSCGAGALALNFGSGKQKKKNGSQRKMMSSRLTMMIRMMSAQMVMIGIDSEQIIPRLRPASVLHGVGPPLSRPLFSGNGSTDSTRSTKPSPFARLIWPHSMSDTMNAVFFGARRRPAGEVSTGSEMRMGRAGASGSKKAASSNG